MSGSETPGFSYSKAKKRRASVGGNKPAAQGPKKRTLEFAAPAEAPREAPKRQLGTKEAAALKKTGAEAPPTPGFHFEKKGGARVRKTAEPTPSKRQKRTGSSDEDKKEAAKEAKHTTPKKDDAKPAAAANTKRKSPEKATAAETKSAAMHAHYTSMKDLIGDAIKAELAAVDDKDPYADILRSTCAAFLKDVEADPALLHVLTAAEAMKLRTSAAKPVRVPNPKNVILKRKEDGWSLRLHALKVEEEQWAKCKAHYTSTLRQSAAPRAPLSPMKLSKEEKAMMEVQSPKKAAGPNTAEVFQSLALNVDDANRTARELEHLRSTADDFFTRLATQVHKQRFKAADTKSLIAQVARV